MKEAKRVVSLIKKGGLPTFVAKINVGSWKNFSKVVSEIAEENLDTVITLGAIVENPKQLYLAMIVPNDTTKIVDTDMFDQLDYAKAGAKVTEYHISENTYRIEMLKFVYEPSSDQSPFKLIDQVFGSVTSYLKKVGVYQEEEEEYEYGFDDI